MFETFIEYMWYLLTTPFKKVKKSLNKWYVFCKVFGRRFDDAKESILIARDEGMVATCRDEMLVVHARDRKLTRYSGEAPDNFRMRIAMHEEVCRLGGLNEGVLLAVRTLGYTDVDIQRYKDFKKDPDRWAEFVLIINMDVGDTHPISFDILKRNVRKWKEVGAKDNYYMTYRTSVKTPEKNRYHIEYRKFIFFFDYLRLDGRWELDGSKLLDAVVHGYQTRIGFRYRSEYTGHFAKISDAWYRFKQEHDESNAYRMTFKEKFIFYEYLRLDAGWTLDGTELLSGMISPERIRWNARFRQEHEESVAERMRYRLEELNGLQESFTERNIFRLTLDYFDYLKLNGLWYLKGTKNLDAQRTVENVRVSFRTSVQHDQDADSRVEYRTAIEEHMEATASGMKYNLTLDYFDYLKLNGLWYLTGSRVLDAQRSSYTVRIE